MKCLILGGGGFLGSHLGDALVNLGHAVRIFERPNLSPLGYKLPAHGIEWFEGDFANKEDIARAVQGCDVVYHLISTTIPKSSVENPIYDIETNVLSTLNLLESVRDDNVHKIIFVSSGGTVYGVPKHLPIDESHPTYPICSYGVCKITIEKYLHLYRSLYGIEYCILRLSNPYGERQRPTGDQGVIASFLNKALKHEPIEIWGDGSIVRDYFYVSDAVDAMIKALNCHGEDPVLNIGSGVGLSLNQVIDNIESTIGHKVSKNYLQGRSFDVPTNILNIEKAQRLLGWKPKVPLGHGLRRTMQWMQDHIINQEKRPFQ